MIYAIVGKPGSGKSYYLVRQCKKLLEQGVDVYSNVIIDIKKMNLKKKKNNLGTCYYWSSLQQFRYINNGVVLLDEAGAYFEPREWAKFSIEDRVKFQQHRKQKLDIYLTVQNFGRVDAVIRQLTNHVTEIKKFYGIFIARSYDPMDIDLKTRKPNGFSVYLFDQKLADCYDTFQMVNLKEHTPFHFKPMESFFSDSRTADLSAVRESKN